MILRLAFRGLLDRPWRSLFLLGGFGLGVGVMITLLAIGEAMVTQSQDEKLVGGGTVTVLPEGLDIEVMKTGGVGGLFVSISNARFVHRQLLASPRLADVVSAVAPQTDGVLLYVRTADGEERAVRAMGEIPSATRAVGAAPTLVAGAWEDDDSDRRWLAPTPAELRQEIDRFHHTPAELTAEERRSWGEWHYFNVISSDRKRWAFLTMAVGGDVPAGEWGGQVLLTVHEEGRAPRRFERAVPAAMVRLDTMRADLVLGATNVRLATNDRDVDRVEVLPDGRYRVTAHATEKGTGARATISLTVSPAPGAYFPGAAIGGEGLTSGYAVPALRADADGELCIDGRCETFAGAQSYHDHNWGTWRDVAWEWGAARAGEFTFLYGRVRRGAEEDVAEPIFLYLVDSLGFRALFRPAEIEYEDSRTVLVDGAQLKVPARATMMDVRGADTLRVEIEVEDAAASSMFSRREVSGTPDARARERDGRWFIQMKGVARLSGQLDGKPIAGEGTGFFETFRNLLKPNATQRERTDSRD